MKTLESWCDLHWADSGSKEPATYPDIELGWNGDEGAIDLCDEHMAVAPDLPLGVLLAAAHARSVPPSPPRRPAGRPAARKPGGGWQQPSGAEAGAIREWVRAGQIMARDDGPARLAYVGKSGRGQYFPVWLLEMWAARKAGQTSA